MITFNNIAKCSQYPGTYTEYWYDKPRLTIVVTENHQILYNDVEISEEEVSMISFFQEEHPNYKYVKNNSENEYKWRDGSIHDEPEVIEDMPF